MRSYTHCSASGIKYYAFLRELWLPCQLNDIRTQRTILVEVRKFEQLFLPAVGNGCPLLLRFRLSYSIRLRLPPDRPIADILLLDCESQESIFSRATRQRENQLPE